MTAHENAESRITRPPIYRIWVNEERTVLVRSWDSGQVEVSVRDDPAAIWGPPIPMMREET